MGEAELRDGLCVVGRWLWQRGLVGSIEGNFSCRLGSDRLLCTPAGIHKGTLKPEEISVVDLEGNLVSGPKPSSELALHLEVYARRADCQAAVHAHPPMATAFALNHETLPDNISPEAAMLLGPVALVPFAMPGTPETREVIRPLLDEHKSFLLANHGALTLGSTLFDAFARMETMERIFQVYANAKSVGVPKTLPEDAFQQLLEHSLNAKLA